MYFVQKSNRELIKKVISYVIIVPFVNQKPWKTIIGQLKTETKIETTYGVGYSIIFSKHVSGRWIVIKTTLILIKFPLFFYFLNYFPFLFVQHANRSWKCLTILTYFCIKRLKIISEVATSPEFRSKCYISFKIDTHSHL